MLMPSKGLPSKGPAGSLPWAFALSIAIHANVVSVVRQARRVRFVVTCSTVGRHQSNTSRGAVSCKERRQWTVSDKG